MPLLIHGGTHPQRLALARARGGAGRIECDASVLPFVRAAPAMLTGARPRTVVIGGIERAFPNAQSGGTRLVLTQSTYLVQKLLDLLEEGDRLIVTADRAALEQRAVEAFQARGPWAAFELLDVDVDRALPARATLSTTEGTEGTEGTEDIENQSIQEQTCSRVSPASSVVASLIRAYETPSTSERVTLCLDAAARAPDDAPAQLALAGACREAGDVTGARAALDRAAALAPDWEAVSYESGKLWLGCDDMERARAAFQRAGDLMPTFSAAFSNLGATLGELDRPDEALAAFRQALAHDARSFTILNNIGVLGRELGRLDESEATLRRVIDLAPDFVFGHYNLGHTLLLADRLPEALAAYEEGWRRDSGKNRRQGCRLAMARFGNGDVDGAARDLWRCANAAPKAEREELLLEAFEIAHALMARHPELAAHRRFLETMAEAIAPRSERLP